MRVCRDIANSPQGARARARLIPSNGVRLAAVATPVTARRDNKYNSIEQGWPRRGMRLSNQIYTIVYKHKIPFESLKTCFRNVNDHNYVWCSGKEKIKSFVSFDSKTKKTCLDFVNIALRNVARLELTL